MKYTFCILLIYTFKTEENVPFQNLWQKIQQNESLVDSLFTTSLEELNPDETFVDLLISKDSDLQLDIIKSVSVLKKELNRKEVNNVKQLDLKIAYNITYKDNTQQYICAFFNLTSEDQMIDLTLKKVAYSVELEKMMSYCEFNGFLGDEDYTKAIEKGETPVHHDNTISNSVTKTDDNGSSFLQSTQSDKFFATDDIQKSFKSNSTKFSSQNQSSNGGFSMSSSRSNQQNLQQLIKNLQNYYNMFSIKENEFSQSTITKWELQSGNDLYNDFMNSLDQKQYNKQDLISQIAETKKKFHKKNYFKLEALMNCYDIKETDKKSFQQLLEMSYQENYDQKFHNLYQSLKEKYSPMVVNKIKQIFSVSCGTLFNSQNTFFQPLSNPVQNDQKNLDDTVSSLSEQSERIRFTDHDPQEKVITIKEENNMINVENDIKFKNLQEEKLQQLEEKHKKLQQEYDEQQKFINKLSKIIPLNILQNITQSELNDLDTKDFIKLEIEFKTHKIQLTNENTIIYNVAQKQDKQKKQQKFIVDDEETQMLNNKDQEVIRNNMTQINSQLQELPMKNTLNDSFKSLKPLVQKDHSQYSFFGCLNQPQPRNQTTIVLKDQPSNQDINQMQNSHPFLRNNQTSQQQDSLGVFGGVRSRVFGGLNQFDQIINDRRIFN